MPKFKVTDNNTGKSYVITAPDQASAMKAFGTYRGAGGQQAPTPMLRSNAPGNGGTSDPNDPQFAGLALPGRQQPPGAPPVNVVPPNQHFGFSSSDTLNPLPAIAAAVDSGVAQLPIVGERLKGLRDQANAASRGITPEQSRAEMNQMVAQNPEASKVGAAAGAVAPYAIAAEVPLLAGAMGFEGPLASRLLMTGLSQYMIGTGDRMSKGETLPEAAGHSWLPALYSTPLAVLGRTKAPTGAHAEAIETLKAEGVPITGGQARGSNGLMRMEADTGGVAAQNFREKQLRSFTSAALRRAGVTADNAGPEVLQGAYEQIGRQFDRLAARTAVRVDQRLQNELLDTVDNFHDLTGTNVPILDKMLGRVGELTAKHRGVIGGDSYQSLHTDLRTAAERASNGDVKGALYQMLGALDDAAERSASGKLLQEWRDTRRHYRNLIDVTDAVKGGGDAAAKGLIEPETLRNAIAAGKDGRSYARGFGDLNQLARAGVIAMPRLPAASGLNKVGPLLMAQGGIAHAVAGGDLKTAASLAVGGAAAPFVAGRAMLSRPGRAILSRGTNVPAVVGRGNMPLLLGSGSNQ